MTAAELMAILSGVPGGTLVVCCPVEMSANGIPQQRVADGETVELAANETFPVLMATLDASGELVIDFSVGTGLGEHEAATGPYAPRP